ncbi:MAG TPA: cytochrome c family protein [Crenalkalicoccus sp.]|jgi:cytochrome c|nr:cytochrome c family protein [Crenalkalicoccus sp.]
MRPAWLLFLVVATGAARAQDLPHGDAEAGKTIFNRQCAVCHSVEPGQNKVGPSLAGVFGRHSAEAPGFNYSPAMRQANKTWDAATLDAYLVDPRAAVPGTRMIFAGLKDAKQRADVIAYLQTLK